METFKLDSISSQFLAVGLFTHSPIDYWKTSLGSPQYISRILYCMRFLHSLTNIPPFLLSLPALFPSPIYNPPPFIPTWYQHTQNLFYFLFQGRSIYHIQIQIVNAKGINIKKFPTSVSNLNSNEKLCS